MAPRRHGPRSRHRVVTESAVRFCFEGGAAEDVVVLPLLSWYDDAFDVEPEMVRRATRGCRPLRAKASPKDVEAPRCSRERVGAKVYVHRVRPRGRIRSHARRRRTCSSPRASTAGGSTTRYASGGPSRRSLASASDPRSARREALHAACLRPCHPLRVTEADRPHIAEYFARMNRVTTFAV
jgi:hypothetical protein